MERHSMNGHLPPRWSKQFSMKSNRFYYFNELTGESTWSSPPLESVDNRNTIAELIANLILKNFTSAPIMEYKIMKSHLNHSFPMAAVPSLPPPESVKRSSSAKRKKKLLIEKKSIDAEAAKTRPPTAIVNPFVLNTLNQTNSQTPPSVKGGNTKWKNFPPPPCSKASNPSVVTNRNVKKKFQHTTTVVLKPSSLCLKPFPSSVANIPAIKSNQGLLTSTLNVVEPTSSTSNESLFIVKDVEMLDSYYIVVDTNILIDDLNRLDELKDTPVNRCGPPYIFIPWIVLQELDRLKRKTQIKPRVASLAGAAIRYLRAVLKAKHPRVYGQSPEEAKKCPRFENEINDDKILNCCNALIKKMPREKVLLLTNDKNLHVKAMVCSINVHDWESMMQTLKPDVEVIGFDLTSKNGKPKPSPEEKLNNSIQRMKRESVHVIERSQSSIHELITNARQILKEVLDVMFEREMDLIFGDSWSSNFKIERHNLKAILNGIVRFWMTVFSLNFHSTDLIKFEFLKDNIGKPEGFFSDKGNCIRILDTIEDVFYCIKKKWLAMNVPIKNIIKIRNSCIAKFSERESIKPSLAVAEKDAQEKKIQSVNGILNFNWSVMNNLCASACDMAGVPHSMKYEKPAEYPSYAEFWRVMPQLCLACLNLKEIMQQLVLRV